MTYVPCSGFTGDNLSTPSPNLTSWYKGGTLLDAVDGFRPPERLVRRPFRMSVSDVFKPQSAGVCVAGRIESGFVQRDDRVLLAPSAEVATVKAVMADEGAVGSLAAFAGDHVQLVLTGGPDQSAVAPGMVACDPAQPITVTKR